MARIRTIKPEFWSDSKTGTLSSDATKLFIGMLNFSDDYGVLENDTASLKAKIFPYRTESPSKLVGKLLSDELFPKGLVAVMSHEQRGYLWIRNFEKHQRVDRPGPSLIPNFTKKEAEKSLLVEPFVERSRDVAKPRAGKEGKGREGKGRERSRTFVASNLEKKRIIVTGKVNGNDFSSPEEKEADILNRVVEFSSDKKSRAFFQKAVKALGPNLVNEAMGEVKMRESAGSVSDRAKYLTALLTDWMNGRKA